MTTRAGLRCCNGWGDLKLKKYYVFINLILIVKTAPYLFLVNRFEACRVLYFELVKIETFLPTSSLREKVILESR